MGYGETCDQTPDYFSFAIRRGARCFPVTFFILFFLFGSLEGASADAVAYSTYLGGGGRDRALGLVTDPAGNLYVAGYSESLDFPGTLAGTYSGGGDVFVAKLDPSGSSILWATYLGGSGRDTFEALTIDPQGNLYLSGFTQSADFPTTPGAFDTTLGNSADDAYVVKLAPDGSLLYGTYLAGDGSNRGHSATGLAVDASGDIYVGGLTSSLSFPVTAGAFDTVVDGSLTTAYVVKLRPAGQGAGDLLYGTYLDGAGHDTVYRLTLDDAGRVIVLGTTTSPDFPTTPGAFDTTGSGSDTFVVKLDPAGNGPADLVFSTLLGDDGSKWGWALARHSSGDLFIGGLTNSTGLVTTAPPGPLATPGGGFDGFIARLSADGSQLLAQVYLGGGGAEAVDALRLDGAGSVWVAGLGDSIDFPFSPDAFQAAPQGSWDGMAARLDEGLSTIFYATLLGTSEYERAHGLAVDGCGNAYVSGLSAGQDFPLVSPLQVSSSGSSDGFVTKLIPDTVAADLDTDGVCDVADNCPSVANGAQLDGDGDGVGDACDLCPADAPGALDLDGDGCRDSVGDVGEVIEEEVTEEFEDAIDDILADPDVPDAVADEVQDALDDLIGNGGGSASNGATDKLLDGDLVPALTKMRQSIEELQDASEGGYDTTELQALVTGFARLAVLAAIEEVALAQGETDPDVVVARGLLADGDVFLGSGDFLGAIEEYKAAAQALP